MHRSERKPRIGEYQMYFLLATLVLMTVGASSYLNSRLVESFHAALRVDRAWSDCLGRVSDIASVAQETNVPGNEIFESGSIEACAVEFEIALEKYSALIAEERDNLARQVESDLLQPMLIYMDRAETSMQVQAREARAIFAQFRIGDRAQAGAHMSAMDRAFHAVNDSLSELSRAMRAAQHENHDRQQQTASQLQRLGMLIAVMIAVLVITICAYGWYSRRLKLLRERKLSEVQAALDASPDRMFLFDTDSHEIRFANRAASQCSPRGGDSWPTLAELLPNLDAVDLMQKVRTLAAAEERSITFKCRLPDHRSGSFPAEVTLTYVSVSESRGSCLVLIRDVSDREQAARKLTLYKKAVDEHSIVAITDRKGRITFANDKFVEISQYDREELIGQDHRLLNSGHHPKSFWGSMYKTVHAGMVWTGRVKNRAKDGSYYWVDTTIVPECTEDGSITGFIAFRKEVTELKQAEESIIKALDDAEVASRAKSEFLANMSHEIRTPMTAILGYADLLSEDGLDPQVYRDHVATIQRNGEHLLTIINDILDLSKIEAGKMTVEQIETSVLTVVEDVASLMRVRAEGKNLALRVEYITSVPELIISDQVRLRQILMNLVGNAIKFTEKGSVTLSVEFMENEESPTLKVAVRDTGIGMNQDQAMRLFSAFAQADSTTTRKFGGTGLGLAISQRLAEMLGGRITVASTMGEGSTFTLETSAKCPEGTQMLVEHGQVPVQEKTKTEQASNQNKTLLADCRILLAEDGPDNQLLISYVLRKAGAMVEVAENGCIAVEAVAGAEARGEPFDLILMDMQMPEMDGLTATTTLRGEGCAIPIVALTAHAMASDRERCLDSGCDDFATKPINRPALIELCRRLACE